MATWPSIRDRILENLKAKFITIQIANGYNLDVQLVERDLRAPSEVQKHPAIFFTAGRELPAHRSFQRLRNEFTPTIVGFVHIVDAQAAATLLEKLIQDIQVAFFSDITRGGLAETSLITEIRVDKGLLPPLAGVELDTQIFYRNPREEP